MKFSMLSAFYPFRGGIAQFNASLFRELEKEHEVTAFTFTRQYPNLLFPGKSQLVSEEDKADPIPATQILDSSNPLNWSSAFRKVKESQPDVLISRLWIPFLAPSAGYVCGKMQKHCNVISILDNVIPHEKRMSDVALTRYFLKRNDGFVIMSDSVEDDLRSISTERKPVLRIDHPIYTHFGEPLEKSVARSQLGVSDEKKVLLFFGFIREYKGLDILLKALNTLPEEYEVVVAGECYGSFQSYQDLIDKNKIGERVHLHNLYISDEEVSKFFSAADLCVLPYRSATQSGITAISFHFDLPVVATDVGGLKEFIQHEKTGMITTTPDPLLVADNITKYFNLKDQVDFKANIRQYKEEHSWARFARSVVEFAEGL